MTAPLTPPHQPPHDDPWQSPSPGPSPYSGDGAERESGFDLGAELRQGVVVLVAVALAGLALGALWMWLAPRVPLVSDDTAVFLKDTEGEEAIAADGTFLLLGLAFGVLCAVLVFLFRRRGGIAVVAGLALGGVLGGVLAWKFGVWLGPTSDVVAHARAVGKGVTFDAPLELNAKGVLLAWPVAAMVVHLALTALFGPRDPEPEWEWGPAPLYGTPPAPQGSHAAQESPAPHSSPGPSQPHVSQPHESGPHESQPHGSETAAAPRRPAGDEPRG
ncbi:ABC transporter permease [Streptomyces corynorhini]|uniref:ABC transporter permease n=1 Tax=Streptomyces corynorhini TaxID=2282652 RepID=UPI001F481DAB|nr:ABC transporter permease [Streptomyces corynorhini]